MLTASNATAAFRLLSSSASVAAPLVLSLTSATDGVADDYGQLSETSSGVPLRLLVDSSSGQPFRVQLQTTCPSGAHPGVSNIVTLLGASVVARSCIPCSATMATYADLPPAEQSACLCAPGMVDVRKYLLPGVTAEPSVSPCTPAAAAFCADGGDCAEFLHGALHAVRPGFWMDAGEVQLGLPAGVTADMPLADLTLLRSTNPVFRCTAPGNW